MTEFAIKLDDVCFSWKAGTAPVLDIPHLAVPAGQRLLHRLELLCFFDFWCIHPVKRLNSFFDTQDFLSENQIRRDF